LKIGQIADAGSDSDNFDPFDLAKDFKFHRLLVPLGNLTLCFTLVTNSFQPCLNVKPATIFPPFSKHHDNQLFSNTCFLDFH
jgi:hypothetical protein